MQVEISYLETRPIWETSKLFHVPLCTVERNYWSMKLLSLGMRQQYKREDWKSLVTGLLQNYLAMLIARFCFPWDSLSSEKAVHIKNSRSRSRIPSLSQRVKSLSILPSIFFLWAAGLSCHMCLHISGQLTQIVWKSLVYWFPRSDHMEVDSVLTEIGQFGPLHDHTILILYFPCHNDNFWSTQRMEFDSVLSEIGEFGPWQRRTALLLFPCAMFAGIHNLLFTFTGGTNL